MRNLYKIYFIPGLGTDGRMFQLLTLDSARWEAVVLDWLPPRQKETLPAYAARMATQIPVSAAPILLVGVSFGGMVAVEIGKIRPPAQVILISSLKTARELPGYLRALGRTGLHHYLPLGWAKTGSWPLAWLFGAKTAQEKTLLAAIIRDADVPFVKWACTAVATWQNKTVGPNLTHLHGHQDWLFPLRYVQQPVQVYKGGHLIIFSAAEQISAYITQEANRIFQPSSLPKG